MYVANNTVHNNSPNAAFESLSKGESWKTLCPWCPLKRRVSSLKESGFIPSASPSAPSCNAGSHSRCLQAKQNAGDCLSLALWQRGRWFHRSSLSLISLLLNSLTTSQKAKQEFGSDWFGSDGILLHVQWQAERWERIQKCHQVTGVSAGAVDNSQYFQKSNSLDLISPKCVRCCPFTELWELKQLLKLLESGGKARKQKTPVALSNSCIFWKVCLVSLLIKGIQSYLTGLPWRHFISVILNSFWKEGQGQRCACQMH